MSSVPMVFAGSLRKIGDAAARHDDIGPLLRTIGLDQAALDDPNLHVMPYTLHAQGENCRDYNELDAAPPNSIS
jgi:hypothetical protein